MRSLLLKGRKIAYEIRRNPRAKHISLTAEGNGSFVLTLPPGVHEKMGRDFIYEKEGWVLRSLERIRRYGLFRSQKKRRQAARSLYLHHRELARNLIERRLFHFNNHYEFSFGRISVKDHRTQWGSCSARRNLNFNYRIYFLPSRLVDYVIVHELCHLKHFNHSHLFWKLIGETIPDYAVREKELRSYLLV